MSTVAASSSVPSGAAAASAAAASYAAQLCVVQPLPSLRVQLGPYLWRADFDSANLARVEYTGAQSHSLEHTFTPAHLASPDTFDCWLSADPMSSYRVFFHFSVRGGRRGKPLRIRIRNLNNKKPLIGEGMLPLVRSVLSAPEWRRLPGGVEFTTLQSQEGPAGRSFLAPEDGGGDEDGDDGGAGAGEFDEAMAVDAAEDEGEAAVEVRGAPSAAAAPSPSASPTHSRQSSSGGGLSARVPRKASAAGTKKAAGKKPKKIKHDTMELTLLHTFEYDDEETFFAFCLPYSYTQLQTQLLAYERRFSQFAATGPPGSAAAASSSSSRGSGKASAVAAASVYFHRELLTHSLEGRRVDLLTISSHRGRVAAGSEHDHPIIPGLFPPPTPDSAKNADPARMWAPSTPAPPVTSASASVDALACEPRASSFAASTGKVLILLSVRVHPGETPSSWMLAGALDFLLDIRDPRAALLRDRAVIKVVPMLNVDGVAHGYYRCDSLGQNLNRFYDAPQRELHPSIWAVRQLVEHWHATRPGWLHTYIDLHAHAMKRGLFLFGNHIEGDGIDAAADALSAQMRNVSFARLVQLNCPYLSLPACNFSVRNMRARDQRDGLSKEGSGRVAFYKLTRCTHAYTVEVNYHHGRTVTPVQPLPEKPWTTAVANPNAAAATVAVSPSAGETSALPGSAPSAAADAEADLSWQKDDHLLSHVQHGPVQYLEPHFRAMGKALMVSVLDLLPVTPTAANNNAGAPMRGVLASEAAGSGGGSISNSSNTSNSGSSSGGAGSGLANPWSRLPLSPEQDHAGLQRWARKWSMQPPKRLMKKLSGKLRLGAAAPAAAAASSSRAAP